MDQEKTLSPASGYVMLVFVLALLGVSIFFAATGMPIFLMLNILTIFLFIGFTVVNPNESVVCVLFGSYKGTIKSDGFYWVNPFYVRQRISLRARNFDSEPIKVNDKVGNPIKIGVVLVWKVENTYKAAFDVDQYEHFVVVQSEAALRKLAGAYPYDNFEDAQAEITLRSGVEEVNEMLEEEIRDRLKIAGIHVIEARINYIAYAEEIASAMLRRQQASAVVAARSQIVAGAVGMVEMALEQLNTKELINLDEEAKASMVSNLMVVLCSDESARPVVNTGTLNH